jgi:hypothetical protein
LKNIVCCTVPNHGMEDNESLENHLKRCQLTGMFHSLRNGMRDERTDNGVWLSEAGRKGFADVMDGTILRPGCSDDGVDVLFARER